jgi:hypothetical protein
MMMVFHPQADEQSKVVNKIITMYRHCMTGSSSPLGSMDVMDGILLQFRLPGIPLHRIPHEPPAVRLYNHGTTCVLVVNQQLLNRYEFLLEILDCLEQAQHYKTYYDLKHHAMEFLSRVGAS